VTRDAILVLGFIPPSRFDPPLSRSFCAISAKSRSFCDAIP